MVNRGILLSTLVIIAMGIAGCGGATNSESESPNGGPAQEQADVAAPKTLGEAADKLVKLRDAMAAGYEAGDAGAVDAAWHEMDNILTKQTDHLKELTATAELDRYDEADVEQAAKKLMETLLKIHPPHGADAKVDPADYEEVSDSIDDQIEKLETIAAKTENGAAGE